MTDVMDYRGPDDAGYVSGDGCSLGARRLSIIDVEGGHQPFANETRPHLGAPRTARSTTTTTCATSCAARGHVLRSRCDTEVLPHLYEEHGPALAERLRGMFAVAVWDQRRAPRRADPRPAGHQAALLRDRPATGSSSAPSSSACSPAAWSSAELDPEAIAAYLMLGYVPGAMTPLKDVRKLLPGERLVVEDGRVAARALVALPGPGAPTRRRARPTSGPRSCSTSSTSPCACG